MAEDVAGRYGRAALTGRPQRRDGGREATLGVAEPSAEVVGQSQLHPADGAQHPFAVAQLAAGLRRERGATLGVAALNREPGPAYGDRRGDVRQPALAPAHPTPARLLARISR